MFLTRMAVGRPITTLMCCFIVVLLGWAALRRLSVDLMPDMTYPTVSISTLYRGAGPEEIETLITRPLEQSLSSVSGVERLASTSTEGSSTIRAQMQWGVDLDASVNDMRQAIDKIRRFLPEEIEEPYIRKYDVADSPVMYLGLGSSLDTMTLTRLAEKQIVPQLERLDGVARVGLRGAVRREIQIDVDRSKLAALNMGIQEVVAALGRENVSHPAGDFEEGFVNLLIRSQGEFHSLDEISATIVRQQAGAVVRISDIAAVIDGEEEQTQKTRINGRPGLMVYIFKQAGSNTIDVSDRVHAAVEQLNRQLTNAELTVRVDKSDFIRDAIANVRMAAVYGMALAVVVLIVFLQSIRSTLVIGVSMPLSVLATFVLIYFQGFTLNMVSFGGLALGIGLLVDNSIVVLESIYRRHEDGLPPREAALEGTREVAGAIVASTLTTLIVFLPMLFIGGTTSILLNQLAWVVSFSLVCSLLASLTLTPMLAAHSLTRDALAKETSRLSAWIRRFHQWNDRGFRSLERGYAAGLRLSLRYRGAVGILLLACLAATVGLVPRIGSEFLPKTDEGDLRIDAVMAPAIQLEQLDRQTQQLERIVIDNVPERRTTAVFIGDDADDGEDWNRSRFRISLIPRSERTRGIDEIRKNVADKVRDVAGMNIRVRASTEMMLFRMLTRNGGDLEVEVRGHDLETAEELADRIEKVMQGITGLVNVEVAREDRRPELVVRIDRAKASLLGVSVSDIATTLESAIRGTEATTYRDEGDEFRILVRLRESDRDRLPDIEQVGVSTPGGSIIPLRNLVYFDAGEAPLRIARRDQQRILVVTADVEDRDLGASVADLQRSLERIPLPAGFTLSIAGDWEEQQKSFSALREGLILAVVLMYMVMASQFESLRDPLLILIAIPLGAIGVIWAMLLTDTTLNVQSFIGLIMLAGIVVNNAIVLVDYMNQLMRAQTGEIDRDDLIVRAAVRRFRPILMTTLTTILAMIPVAFGWGEGGELQAPMARVVIGGLTSGTLITLLAIPLIYRTWGARRRQSPAADIETAEANGLA